MTTAGSDLGFFGSLGVCTSSVHGLFVDEGPKPLSVHRIFCLWHSSQDFPVVVVKPKSKKKKSPAQTNLGLPRPTRTQHLCTGSLCTCASPAPSPSHTLQFRLVLLPHWPPMPSEPPLPE